MDMKITNLRSVKLGIPLFACIVAVLSGCGRKDGKYVAELYATNDLHGKFFDSLYVNNEANKYSLANISAFLKEKRAEAENDNILLVDVGDALQGDNAVYYANYVDTNNGKHLFSRIAEYMQYDALVVGNHDIETGHPVYDKIKDECPVPYLAANAIDVNTGKSYFKPYAVFDRGGVKIAVIGMTNPNMKKWLGEELWYGLDFLPIEELANSLVKEIEAKEKPDVIVLAIHAGLGNGTSEDVENPARYLAAKIQGVDIILSSHDHQVACEKIWNGADSVLVIDGSNRAKYLMNAHIEIDCKGGKVVGKSIKGQLISMEGTPIDTDYMNVFRDDFLKAKAFTNQEIGELAKDINTQDAFFGPSDYIDLVHSVQLWASNADISLAAPLTYNGTVKAGKLTYHDLFTIYPFENQLYVISLTGEQLHKCLEYSYETWIRSINNPGDHIMNIRYDERRGRYSFVNMAFNFDSAAGIDYVVDVKKPFGERVIIKSMSNGEPFDINATYKVALSSYRANGGGDLLTNGAGIPKEGLNDIIVAKMNDIRGLIYDYYKSGKANEKGAQATWKFVPEHLVKSALERDRKLLFGKAN